MTKAPHLILVFLLVLSSACTVHRIDVQQGNVITKDMVEQLKTGMSKRQVMFVMGSPLIQDPFHKHRWDYVFTLQPGSDRDIVEYKRVTLHFDEDKVSKVDVFNVN